VIFSLRKIQRVLFHMFYKRSYVTAKKFKKISKKGEKENANEPQEIMARFRVDMREFVYNSECASL